MLSISSKCLTKLLVHSIKTTTINRHVPITTQLLRFSTSTDSVSTPPPPPTPEPSSQSPPTKFDLIFAQMSKNESISRAMQFYLKKIQEKETITKEQIHQFELGKRHLANMMGVNPNRLTAEYINKAIAYLLPSGIFDKKARPFMKHPDEYFPKSEAAEFTPDGRPLHSFFYTKHPVFYELIYTIMEKWVKLNKYEDTMNILKHKMMFNQIKEIVLQSDENELEESEETNQSELGKNEQSSIAYTWISQVELEGKLKIKLNEAMYEKFLNLITKLASHQYADREDDFLNQYRTDKSVQGRTTFNGKLEKDSKGKMFAQFTAKVRTAIATVKLYEGNGQVSIKGPDGDFDITYFDSIAHRENILFPFKVVNQINKFDLVIKVNMGGMTGLSKAIRYAVARCLCSYVSQDEIEKLRLSGLLTIELRNKERQKPGQEGARRKYPWLKR